MKKHIIITYIIIIAIAVFPGCKKLIEVDNTNLTESAFLNTPNATNSWISGLRREMALMLNQTIVNTELVSDNYYNNNTENSKVFDIPQIASYDPDVNSIQAEIQRVRAMTEYGLNKIAPADLSTTADQKAEMWLYNGYTHLLSGELFVGLPGSVNGPVLTASDHYKIALNSFSSAMQLYTATDDKLVCTLLQSRTYYDLGDANNAAQFATQSLANPLLLKQIQYDGVNNVMNSMQNDIFSSATNQFAPLPRLDFLDPKYFDTGIPLSQQMPITIVKAEEAYLIIAESQQASGLLVQAQQTLKSMLAQTINNRPVVVIDGKKQKRSGVNRTDYPKTADVNVAFDSNSPIHSGYILDRQAGNIPAYTVSGTKVTNADIDAVTSADDLLYLIYRLRQEVFISEGRRMTDLGIRFPVSDIEASGNSNVLIANKTAQIPSFIPPKAAMDDFTYDQVNKLVIMKFDMNKVLVQNKHAKEIFPFIN